MGKRDNRAKKVLHLTAIVSLVPSRPLQAIRKTQSRRMSTLSTPEETPSERFKKWRMSERSEMVEAIRDLIEESRKRAKSNYTPSSKRATWTRLAGQLIWYKDQILRTMVFEALAEEVAQLKKQVEQSLPGSPPPRAVMRRTVKDRPGRVLPFRKSIATLGEGKGPRRRRTRVSKRAR